MRVLVALACLLFVPLSVAAPPGETHYAGIGTVDATHLSVAGPSIPCSAQEMFTVDYVVDEDDSYGTFLRVHAPAHQCLWAPDHYVALGGVTFGSCHDGTDATTCSRDPYECPQGPWSCYGQATIFEDGSIEAWGYDYTEHYDPEGNYAGTSGTSWSFEIDSSVALPWMHPFLILS